MTFEDAKKLTKGNQIFYASPFSLEMEVWEFYSTNSNFIRVCEHGGKDIYTKPHCDMHLDKDDALRDLIGKIHAAIKPLIDKLEKAELQRVSNALFWSQIDTS